MIRLFFKESFVSAMPQNIAFLNKQVRTEIEETSEPFVLCSSLVVISSIAAWLLSSPPDRLFAPEPLGSAFKSGAQTAASCRRRTRGGL